MSFELGEAFVRVRADMSGFESDARTGISGAFSGFTGPVNDLGRTINRTILGAITAAVAGGTALIGAGLFGGVQRALDREEAIITFGRLGLDDLGIERLTDNIDQALRGTPITNPEGFQQAGRFLAMGFDEADIPGIIGTIADAASVGNRDFGEMADVFARAAGQGKITAEELNRMGDIPLARVAEELGMTEAELRDLASTGGLSAEMFLEGFSAIEEFNGAAKDPTTRTALRNLTTAWSALGEKLVSPLFGEGGPAIRFLEKLREGMTFLTPLVETLASRVASNLAPALDRIGDSIAPFMRGLFGISDAIDPLTGQFIGGAGAANEFGIKINEVLSAVGDVVGVIRDWVAENPRLAGAIAMAVPIAFGLASAINAIRWAFMFLMRATPIGMILALVTALVYAYQNSETFRNIVNNAFTAVRDVVGPIIERVVGWVSGLGQSTSETGTWLAETWAQIQATFQSAIDAITAIVTFFVDFAMDIWDRFGEHILSAAQQIWEHIQQIIGGVLDVIQGIFEVFAGAFTGDWSRVWEGIKQIFSGVWEAIKGVFGSAVTIVKTVLGAFLATVSAMWSAAWNRIRSFFSSIWNSIKSIVTGVLSSIYTTVVSRFIAIRTAITNAINAARARVTAVFNAIRTTITTVVNAVRTRVSSAFNTVRTLVTTAVNAVKTRVTAAFNAVRTAVMTRLLAVVKLVRGLPGRALAALGNIKTKLKSAGRKLIQGFVDGILAVARRPVEAVSGIISNVRNLLPFSPAKEGPLSGRGYPLYSGQAIGEDLASGLDRSRSSARHAAEKLMREVSGAMSTSTSRGLAVAGAAAGRGAGGGAGGGDTYNIEKVVIPARDIQEFKDVTDFFKEVRQVARKGGVG